MFCSRSRGIFGTMSAAGWKSPFSRSVREYSQHDALAGRRVTVASGSDEPPITGRCQGIDNTGRLLVRRHSKIYAIVAGMVAVLPSPGRSAMRADPPSLLVGILLAVYWLASCISPEKSTARPGIPPTSFPRTFSAASLAPFGSRL